MSKIVIPEGMLKAAQVYLMEYASVPLLTKESREYDRVFLEGALRWLDGELEKLMDQSVAPGTYYREPSMSDDYHRLGNNSAIEKVRRMFLAPEPEVPDAIKDLLSCAVSKAEPVMGESFAQCHDRHVIEAYRRGCSQKNTQP